MSSKLQKKISQTKVAKALNNLPIAVKVTAWYTTFLFILLFILVFISFLITDNLMVNISKNELIKIVNGISTGKKTYTSFDEGVFVLHYSSDGRLLEGKLPNSFNAETSFKNGIVEQYVSGSDEFLYLDSQITGGPNKGDWIRGIVPISNLRSKISLLPIVLFIISPIILLIIAFVGYKIIKTAFKPVKQISDTAKDIGKRNDLTQRIILEKGNDEIHQMADAFNEMLDSISNSYEREKQFSSDVSHELRTPVSVILAESQYGENHVANLEEAKNSFRVISRQARKMSKMINQLLEISKMDQTMEIDKTIFDFSEMLLSMIQDYKSLAENKDLTLSFNIEKGIFINGNKIMLQRVFDNLFSNALKFAKSHIVISLTKDKHNKKCTLSIKDDGPGIETDDQNKIWERFYQVDSSRNKNSNEGFGLGLSMVKRIAELHDAEISVKSIPGKGSMFAVKFNLAD